MTWRWPGKKIDGIGNQRQNRVYSDQSTVEISQNTEKSPEDMRRLDLTQTPVKDHQLKKIVRIENQRQNRAYTDHSTVEIRQNTEKSPGNLMRIAVSQTGMKDYKLK